MKKTLFIILILFIAMTLFIGILWNQVGRLKNEFNLLRDDFRQTKDRLKSTIVLDENDHKKYILEKNPNCELNKCLKDTYRYGKSVAENFGVIQEYKNICNFYCEY